MKFTISGRLDGLNEYIRKNRANKYSGNSCKQLNEMHVKYAILNAKLPKVSKYPIKLKITWYEPNAKRDIDNIVFATKFIQDALVKNHVLKNDNQSCINKVEHDVKVDRQTPRIEVEILENG